MNNMNKGFTLIETLVYLGLFTLMIGGMVSAAYVLFQSSDRNQTTAMMQEEENYIMAKFNSIMNNARAVSVSHGTELTVTAYDGSIREMCLSGVDIKLLARSGTCPVSGVILNNANVTISTLSFVHVGEGSRAEGIEMNITMHARMSNGMIITHSTSMTRFIRI
jgi:type II secretory pathway pseudopilin PulG